MALTELACAHQFRCRRVEIAQSQEIAHGHAIKTDFVCDLLVSHREVQGESPQSDRALHRIEILTLDVLDEREFSGVLITQRADDGWNSGEA